MERAQPQRRFGGILGDPCRLQLRLDPLIQVVAHEHIPFLAVFLAEAKEPPHLVVTQMAGPQPAKGMPG